MTADVIEQEPFSYYNNPCTWVTSLIEGEGLRVLDVGCSKGEAGKHLLDTGKAAWVSGVELDHTRAAFASRRLNEVICDDVTTLVFPWPVNHFDCITFHDVLEHVADPWSLLARLRPLLKPDGILLASVPNVRFFPVIYDLLIHNEWRYQDFGVMDRGHLRFFTKKTTLEMFNQAGFKVDHIAPYLTGLRYKLPSRLSFGLLDNFMSAQWRIRARLARHS